MVFDATSSNTGINNGAAIILQCDHIQQNLLTLALRHHVMEIIVSDVRNLIFDDSTSLTNLLFKSCKMSGKILMRAFL